MAIREAVALNNLVGCNSCEHLRTRIGKDNEQNCCGTGKAPLKQKFTNSVQGNVLCKLQLGSLRFVVFAKKICFVFTSVHAEKSATNLNSKLVKDLQSY